MPPLTEKRPEKKPVKFSNFLLGAGLNLFEVTVRHALSRDFNIDLSTLHPAKLPRVRLLSCGMLTCVAYLDPRSTSRGRQDHHGREPWR